MHSWVDEIKNNKLRFLIRDSNNYLKKVYDNIDENLENNQHKVLKAFQKHKITENHLLGSTGYGYGDLGRDGLDDIYATVFGGEKGLVRSQFVSGTHCLSCCLNALLSRGDELLYVTGDPYDTLEKVIGINPHANSLISKGVTYSSVELKNNMELDFEQIEKAITPKTKVIGVQRSKGYSLRSSIAVAEVEALVRYIKRIKKDLIVFVDNCYGEFVEGREPAEVGADVVAGSLTKNPGGGLAKTGGYVVGKKEYIEKVAESLTAAGLGSDIGASLQNNLDFYQGFFKSPKIVSDSLKTAVFISFLAQKLGFEATPNFNSFRYDIVQTVTFKDKDKLLSFCRGIQKHSPINSFVSPIPDYLPGYQDPVIMAAGTFIQGSSIELSADAPIKPPYTVFVQGSLSFEHGKIAAAMAFDELLET
ncbi:aminotransferase class I/II-fold pyridoxal phosphate-dependent enzyme [Proteinivorax tanatarense]|uniref:Aminotransferase class I/II-fold pyridoxal phosphate-dependent enzyme n=1 Tax=Proteinivorax tanatarense TaxID=1260629 RepID=A0AAU7VRK8_9FIRM